MAEEWWIFSTKQTGDHDLSACGSEYVFPTNDQIDPLLEVVHGDCELICPLALPIHEKQIAALLAGVVFLAPDQQILERYDLTTCSESDPVRPELGKSPIPAGSRIHEFFASGSPHGLKDDSSTAITAVDSVPVLAPLAPE